jgi:hypothetical protein
MDAAPLPAPAVPEVSLEPATVVEPETPSAPEIAATAVAAAAVASAASLPVEPVVPAPVEAVAAAEVLPAEPAPALGRRARRTAQTAEQPQIVDAQVVEPLGAETPAPAETPATVITPEPIAAAVLPDAVLIPAEPFELLEPVVTEEPVAMDDEPVFVAEPAASESFEQAWQAASDVDAFEAAARLFSFTGETPIQSSEEPEPEVAEEPSHSGRRHSRPRAAEKPAAAARASRPNSGAAFKRVTAASFSVGVMGIVGLLTVGMTTPAEAVASASGNDISSIVVAPGDMESDIEQDAQAYVAPATAEDVQLNRTETYATATMAQLAHESGIQNFSNFFVNDPNSPIQWPFAVGVPISYGFGMRSGRMHEGVDFTPGAGSPIQAIADGTVRIATNSGGAYGVTVVIDHMIDGQLVSSRYAHMQYGSLQVSVGQKVTVGTLLGRTGNTGRSYGAHTHFEILLGGTTAIDPIPWLRAHAGG